MNKGCAGSRVSIENHIVPVFPRYRQDGVTYSVASEHNSRNNSIRKFYRPVCGKEEWLGSIQKFCLVNGNPIVIVSIFDNTDEEVLAMPQSQHRHSLSEDVTRQLNCSICLALR